MKSTVSNSAKSLAIALFGASVFVNTANASETNASTGWTFGIGTGFTSFSVDGDVGFASKGQGGAILDLNLDNGETSDLVDSAAGFNAFARNQRWMIQLGYGNVTLKDSEDGLEAEWDKTQSEIIVGYTLAIMDCNAFGVQVGARRVEHDWKFSGGVLDLINSPDDDWTDAVVGVTHSLRFADKWAWNNVVNYGFGGSEGTTFAQTQLSWRPLNNWMFSVNARYLSTEYGDKGDINDSDFYYYDADEPSVGLGVHFVW